MPISHDSIAEHFKVIAQELSQALCTLRLANVYDLSSVGNSLELAHSLR